MSFGSSMPNSLSSKYATPPLPDCELTRMTSRYSRPMSAGSIVRYGTSQWSRQRATVSVFPLRQTFFDRVLMRAAERGEDQFARVRLARRNRHAGATLINVNDRIEIREIQFRINAVHVKIQRHGDDVQIAGAFAVAEQRAFDAIRAGEQAEFRRRHAGAAVIVRVQADDERVAVFDVRQIHSI